MGSSDMVALATASGRGDQIERLRKKRMRLVLIERL